ncbi:SPOR domain-containing protein [Chryseobacterium koreense]
MRSFTKVIAILSLFSLNLIEAQQVVKKDTISGTPLTISMDKRIEDMLVSQEQKCLTSNTKNVSASDDESHNIPKIVVPERELSQAEICRKNPRIMGYKIQLAVVKSNEEAREVGMYFRRRFPNMKVEIDASLRPNYKVMAGSYLSKQSAASDLASIKKYFENAVAIQYRVFCVEAK